ncbi:MAG: V-type ATPase subunit [Deltaproteobacteria bacterium]|nr:V-type ATPase subunit [Deltaproteobacteria bacterium]
MRAWKGKLLSREELEALYGIGDLDGLVKRLKDTPYGRDIEETKARDSEHSPLQLLTPALKNHIVRIHETLKGNCPGDALLFLEAVIAPFEVRNIKTVMRGIEHHADPEEAFAATIPTWRLDTKAMKELIDQKDIRSVISLLDTWGMPYARPLREGYGEYLKEKKLSLLEMELDRFVIEFYLEALDSSDEDGKFTMAILSKRADGANLLNALKFISEGFIPDHPLRYFVKGGTIDSKEFLRLLEMGSVGDLMEAIPAVLHGREWKEGVGTVDLSNPLLLESFLNNGVRRFICRHAVEWPLSIAVPLCFLYAKYSEVERLRLIASGISFSIPQGELRSIIGAYQ